MRNEFHHIMKYKNPEDRMKARTNIFTIIELLIVIGVIAVLISMLLPALNKAREKVKSIECLNRYKQLGLAFNLYSSDYSGYFPACINISTGTNYNPDATGAGMDNYVWDWMLFPYFNTQNLLYCPLYAKFYDGNHHTRTYIMGMHIGDNFIKIAKIKKPSKVELLGERHLAISWNMAFKWGYSKGNRLQVGYADNATDPHVYRIHGNQLNYLFTDGHAASCKGILELENFTCE